MTDRQLIYDKLKEAAALAPNREAKDFAAASTFLVCELLDNDEHLDMRVMVIDPELEEEQDAKDFLSSRPRQRALMTISQMLHTVASDWITSSTDAPLDPDLCKEANGNQDKLAYLVQREILKTIALSIAIHGIRNS